MDYSKVFDKPFIFITGAPRSGTSLVTKIIGAHPDIAMIMENIFGNRRRHWEQADFWNSKEQLQVEVFNFYRQFSEPILGNKVCTPDVWSCKDIEIFCSLFKYVKIVFVVRDPRSVVISRYNREDYDKVFSEQAINKMQLDFSNKTRTYLTSWKQSIEVYKRLKRIYQEQLFIVYYDSLVADHNENISMIFSKLGIEPKDEVFKWYESFHYNSKGLKVRDLKYSDVNIFKKEILLEALPPDFSLDQELETYFKLFLEKRL